MDLESLRTLLIEIEATISNRPLTYTYTPNANMADRSVAARDELHESEASWAYLFCFNDSSPRKSCFFVDLVYFLSPSIKVFVFVNTTRTERNLPQ